MNERIARMMRWRNALLVVIAGGLLCALPLVVLRHGAEQSNRVVSFVADYRDIVEASSMQGDPHGYVRMRLDELRALGMNAMAVYESTLRELAWAQHVRLYTKKEVLLARGAFADAQTDNATVVVFLHQEARTVLLPLIEASFGRIGVRSVGNTVEIAMPIEAASVRALDPDPIAMRTLRALGFSLVVRLSDQRQPFDAAAMRGLLERLRTYGVRWIVFDGPQVTGAADDEQQRALAVMAQLLREAGIGVAAIELAKPQVGFASIAKRLGYDAVRLHSVPADVLREPDEVVDRVLLAVRERNVRLVFWNNELRFDAVKGAYKDASEPLARVLGPQFQLKQLLERQGFTFGEPSPMRPSPMGAHWRTALKAGVAVGAIACIAWTLGMFVPVLALPLFVIGLLMSAIVYLGMRSWMSPLLALGVAVCGAVLAMMPLVHVRNRDDQTMRARVVCGGYALLGALGIAFGISAFVVALLDTQEHMLGIALFRGVGVLHVVPIVLTMLYALYVHYGQRWSAVWNVLCTVWRSPLRVWAFLALIAGVGTLLFYVSRTGNAGKALEVERVLRQWMTDVFGVRPRTKEFLFAYPAIVVAVVFGGRARWWSIACVVAGTIGIVSLIDTFAHLHTPLMISFLRSVYGAVLGTGLGVVVVVSAYVQMRRTVRKRGHAS
ncbi:MAG: hypothetical protein KGO83_02460 [Paenibacillaceae bacterium]|nr:hypothetical protein [Paenibacillaceae bacterium]